MANSSAKSSNFAVTCSLLSHYMKEKGTRSLADLSFSPPLGKTDTYRPPPTTISFLPGADVSGDKPADTKNDFSAPMELFPQRAGDGLMGPAADTREPQKAQLTIFYGGKVLVFDDFPSDKASDLMQLAGMKSGTANNLGLAPPEPTDVVAAAAAKATTVTMKTEASAPTNSLPVVKSQPQNQKPTQVIVSNLPIARKASLHRFLEKRKDRISAKTPYQVKEDSPANSGKAAAGTTASHQPWLGLQPGLGSQLGR